MNIGDFCYTTLELIKDDQISRPRMRPITDFDNSMRVEVSRKLREMFPIGTQFKAKVKLCQKHLDNGKPKGGPYLRVQGNDIGVILSSVADKGIIARLDPTGADGRKYYYIIPTD